MFRNIDHNNPLPFLDSTSGSVWWPPSSMSVGATAFRFILRLAPLSILPRESVSVPFTASVSVVWGSSVSVVWWTSCPPFVIDSLISSLNSVLLNSSASRTEIRLPFMGSSVDVSLKVWSDDSPDSLVPSVSSVSVHAKTIIIYSSIIYQYFSAKNQTKLANCRGSHQPLMAPVPKQWV